MANQIAIGLVIILGCATTVLALECTKATSAFDKALCANPTARKSDEAMSKTYFALLASLSDRDEREALIASQRRWLKARASQDASMYDDSSGGFGSVLKRQSDDRRALFESRIAAVPTVVARMERQRALLSAYPGRFAGFNAQCFIIPPHFGGGDGSYYCTPFAALQKGDRLCRQDSTWASGHETEVWTVAKVDGDAAFLLATCKIGYASGPECSPMDAPNVDIGWTRTPGIDTPDMSDLAKDLRPLDPDMDVDMDDRMKRCLSEAQFPAPDEFVDAEPKKRP